MATWGCDGHTRVTKIISRIAKLRQKETDEEEETEDETTDEDRRIRQVKKLRLEMAMHYMRETLRKTHSTCVY